MSNPYLNDDSSYYYGYGYNQAGYGYGGGYDTGSHRSLKDYLLIFRERIWYFIPTFFIILAAAIIYTFNATPIYRASATVEILRDDPRVLGTMDIEANEIRSAEDFNTQVMIMQSLQIVNSVDRRLQGEDRQRFLAPYEDGSDSGRAPNVAGILYRNRTIEPARLSLIVAVRYEHPDKNMAAMVANLFAEEFINYNLNQTIDVSNKAVEDLRMRADVQRKKVEELELRLSQYREDNDAVSIDAGENIAIQEIQRLNDLAVTMKSEKDFAETRVQQIEQFRAADRPLWEIPAIGNNLRVSSLLSTVSQNRIDIAALSQRYRDKHPSMIQAREALSESLTELEAALKSAEEEVRSDYLQSVRNYEQAEMRLAAKEQDMFELGKLRVEYNAILSELEVEKAFYQAIVSRMSQELAQVELQNAQARMVDRANPPGGPYKPLVLMNLALGGILGVGSGLGLVFLIAFLDDRIKTAYDIESVVGLPLIGIIPRVKKLDASEKAKAVAENVDRHVTEAFRTIHSTLKLGEESKNAKVVLTTSTVPGEGKSFVSTNVAFTYAAHGEKTLLVDGDLRLPNVQKSLQIEVDGGVVNFFEDEGHYSDYILKDLYPGFDVLAAGGKAKNPTQVLNSPKFAEMINELRKSYDKIVIDSPPLAAVSDALNFLPMVDGVLYVIKFNTVKRKTAKVNVKRMWESSTPVFGAILNNIGSNISSYYYSHYYDRSYQDYYSKMDAQTRPARGREGAPPPQAQAPYASQDAGRGRG